MIGYRIVRFIVAIYAKIFYRLEIIGRENEPKDGGCIAIANHASFLDPIAVAAAIKRDVCFMAKSDLQSNKFMQWVFKMCNVIAIRRGESDMAALRKSCEAVKDGNILGIFPQGTRIRCESPDAETALPGVGLIAMRTKAPVLPIAVCYGKKNKKPTAFRKVRVVIGKPIPYEEYSVMNGEKASSHDMAKYTFSKVCELFAENNYD